jgi:hypothetical protein
MTSFYEELTHVFTVRSISHQIVDSDYTGISKNRLFLQGLSENMNDDSFIDTRYPSVIAIDDLMRDATNSKDVCELCFVLGL